MNLTTPSTRTLSTTASLLLLASFPSFGAEAPPPLAPESLPPQKVARNGSAQEYTLRRAEATPQGIRPVEVPFYPKPSDDTCSSTPPRYPKLTQSEAYSATLPVISIGEGLRLTPKGMRLSLADVAQQTQAKYLLVVPNGTSCPFTRSTQPVWLALGYQSEKTPQVKGGVVVVFTHGGGADDARNYFAGLESGPQFSYALALHDPQCTLNCLVPTLSFDEGYSGQSLRFAGNAIVVQPAGKSFEVILAPPGSPDAEVNNGLWDFSNATFSKLGAIFAGDARFTNWLGPVTSATINKQGISHGCSLVPYKGP